MRLNKISSLCSLILFLSLFTISAQDSISLSQSAVNRHRAAAQNIQEVVNLFEARSYISKNKDTLDYRLLKPLNYNPKKKYPIVVCLSGSGGRADDNRKQIPSSWPAQVLAKMENRTNYPCFVFVPQCPPGKNWGASGVKNISKQLPSVELEVMETIKILEEEFSIDTERRYVTGQSMGGYGSWHYILTHPKMFAAAVPICGGGDPDMANRIKNIPVWAFHGDKDSAIPVDYSRSMIKALKDTGGKPLYTEFKDVGHICWPLAYDTPELLDWMFSKKTN